MTREMTVSIVLVALGSIGFVGCGGKGTAGTCSTYGACGADAKGVSGNWRLVAGCANLIVSPYQEPSLPEQLQQPQTLTQAPPQPQPTTSGDWCSQLVYEPSTSPSMAVRGVVLWHGPPSVSDGYLNQAADPTDGTRGTYSAQIQFRTHETTYFANACLTRFERVAPSCAKFGTDLEAYFASQPGFKFDPATPTCTGDSAVGCTCRYDYQVQAGEMGTWQIDPASSTTIVYAGTSRTEPQSASFCQQGDTLELSGLDGTSLFNAAGVRSAKLQRDAAP
ncbi:MAG: hypothetical protein JWM82_114 [Myxococcales bacterium]|nr:hypothetical protein [Myxococcales bacterium]